MTIAFVEDNLEDLFRLLQSRKENGAMYEVEELRGEMGENG